MKFGNELDIREVVGEDGEAGYSSSIDRPDDFAEKILMLIENKNLRATLGQSGFNRARQLFNANQMAAKYCKLIKSPD